MSNRHAFRAKWHDYCNGIYFVTICTHEKRHIFGAIIDGVMVLSGIGHIVDDCVKEIPQHHHNVEIWNYVIMPNHIHLIIAVGARYIAPTSAENSITSETNLGCLKPPMHGESCDDFHHNSELAIVVGTFKAAVTRIARRLANDSLTRARCIAPLRQSRIWQRLFHEHIIRNRFAFENIMNYIDNNVTNWNKDCFYDK